MKLSAVALSALITFSAVAQNPKQQEKPKTKTSSSKKIEKAKHDSTKVSIKSKTKSRPISSHYCPPCGMG